MSWKPMQLVVDAREYLDGRYGIDPDGADVKLIQRFQTLVVDQYRIIDFLRKLHTRISAEVDTEICQECGTAWPCKTGNGLTTFGAYDE